MAKKHGYPGVFITLEGGDGTGKSTQARLLTEFIEEKRGKAPLLTREPGGAPGADEIRELILTGEPERWDVVGETLLFYASRRNHLRLTVWPALERGEWVISDRFADSTMAYQGYGNQLGSDKVQMIHDVSVGDFEPDLTIILDIDPATGIARTQGRTNNEDRFEKMDLSVHERMREGFFDIAKKNAHRCVIVDVDRNIDTIQADLRQIVNERLFS